MNLWFSEDQTPNMRIGLRIEEILHRERSPYQEITVYETAEFGRLLTLDDIIMTTERDEFVYHEMLAHPALVAHPEPRQVLVVGGGDGGTVREVLKHPTVERVVLAELDERVVEVSKLYLPSLAQAFDDPRVEFRFGDGALYVAEHPNEFDVILVDSPDPVGPAAVLFSEAFYRTCRAALRPGGIITVQSESPWFNREQLWATRRYFREIFPLSRLHWAPVPTYPGGFWTFTSGSLGPDPKEPREEAALQIHGRYYSLEIHRAAFVLPPFVKELA